MADSEQKWQRVGVDSYLEAGPSETPVVPHRGRIEVLPFELLSWADFESLQWRILRDVEGLRHPWLYGDPGQRQLGLDIVAEQADGKGVALQSKRVKVFGPSQILAAVDAFRKTKRPFDVSRLILGVSRDIRTTKALDKFKELQRELEPVEFELWDQKELSRRLKAAPEIVIEYFGMQVAEAFCDPFALRPRVVPPADSIEIRRALARTPEATTGAGEKVARAKEQAETDPNAALILVEEAQASLSDVGFDGHSAQHEDLRSSLLVAVGRGEEATRRRLDQLWLALDKGQTTAANIASRGVRRIADQVDTNAAREDAAVAALAVTLYENPLAVVPDFDELKVGSVLDRARLAILAGETALASHNPQWLASHVTKLRNIAGRLLEHKDHQTHRVRLRLLAAEGSGDWVSLLGEARTLKLDYDLGALVQARHARYLANQQRFYEADASWDEATGNACLAERWTDAARWTFSRRAFRTLWNPFSANELLPVQTALSARGPDLTVLPRDEDAINNAYARLSENKLRPAAISAQRALRDAVTLSDWEGERRARRLLADVLIGAGEHLLAAEHLVLAGAGAQGESLGAERPTEFLDVTQHMTAEPWWVVGAAYRVLAKQADLVPDEVVEEVSATANTVLDSADSGDLVDVVGMAGSRYLSAIAVLAGLSDRLSLEQAEKALRHFESQPAVESNHYRYHDENEATIVAGILSAHSKLSDRCLKHLVALLNRSQSSRGKKTIRVVTERMESAAPLLQRLADGGSSWARELLESEDPKAVSTVDREQALGRLTEPLVHAPGVFTHGSGSQAVHDSVLVRTLPVRSQYEALVQLLERAADPLVTAGDRASYLIAASNLRPPSSTAKRHELMKCALGLALDPPQSTADELDAPFRHPLGTVRIQPRHDTRAEAVFLAAALARTGTDKKAVRAAALSLVGDDGVSAYWVTVALQTLGDTMAPDVGFLSGQDWALKSFAAILWSQTPEPAPVGYRLAADPDVRVRRALATHLVEHSLAQDAVTAEEQTSRPSVRAEVLAILLKDPCFSVRKAAGRYEDQPGA